MFNFSSLQGSIAQPLESLNELDRSIEYTFSECRDEKILYRSINSRLKKLESSLEIDQAELEAIQIEAKDLLIAYEEKEEVNGRIDFLSRLYIVKKELNSALSIEDLKKLRRKISSFYSLPLKQGLGKELDLLEEKFTKNPEANNPSSEELLMKKAIKDANPAFINLGEAGRNYVINVVVEQYGKEAGIKEVQESISALERKVQEIVKISDKELMLEELKHLPIPTFHEMTLEMKEEFANNLVENKAVNDLVSLNEYILFTLRQKNNNEDLNHVFSEDAIQTPYGEAATTINAKGLV
ncbi:hypothetical protein [Planococcus glaciei]|uniref:hypothetical protein n=1 Tax=Planococcus glaciei TaxID=459472 RepID=UPI001C7332C1|nr:hypothetical protein [Planococcus glaciei]MBX0316839.1 hypothetical protein [Planococcus glaciei]